MNINESIILAFGSIRVNKLRAILTLLSISIGVFAIMGAGTLISSINGAVTDELAELGENTIIIKKWPSFFMGGNAWHKYAKRKPINYTQVKELKHSMNSTDKISAASYNGGFTIKNGNLTTDPDVTLIGTDENYFQNNNINIVEGRAINAQDLMLNQNVALIGNDVTVKIFPHESPLDKKITINNQSFTIVGILETKGAMMGQSQDNYIYLPINQFLKYYTDEHHESISLYIRALTKEDVSLTMDEAIGNLRSIRNVKPWEENDFEVETNETITEQFQNFTQFLTIFGNISGIIALFTAGVGIMNIMLVSVKERTREIGIRKAIGARKGWIMTQFLIETITLCQVGGIVGIVLGIGGAELLGKAISIHIVFPIYWIVFSIIVCSLIGIVFGLYPAWKAAKLDPIDALRYE